MKGISSVIVIILLMLLVVGGAGVFYLWGNRFQSDVSGESQREMDRYSSEAGMLLDIESVSQCSIYVRNQGTKAIPLETINLVVDGRSVQFNSSVDEVDVREQVMLEITSDFNCERDECVVRIISAGEQSRRVPTSELQCGP